MFTPAVGHFGNLWDIEKQVKICQDASSIASSATWMPDLDLRDHSPTTKGLGGFTVQQMRQEISEHPNISKAS